MLDEIDREAAREGLAISKLRRPRKGRSDPRGVKKIKPIEDPDILRILNILDGRRA